jgi:hypothetical protein
MFLISQKYCLHLKSRDQSLSTKGTETQNTKGKNVPMLSNNSIYYQ